MALVASFACLIKILNLLKVLQFIYSERICVFLRVLRMEVSDRNTRGLRGSHLWPYVGWAKPFRQCGWPWFYLDEKNTWNPTQQTGSHVPTGMSALRKWHKWGQDICCRDVRLCLREPDLNTASAAATSEERWIAALICIPQQLAGEKAFMTDWKCIFRLNHTTENWSQCQPLTLKPFL